jgi:hypothetical protein
MGFETNTKSCKADSPRAPAQDQSDPAPPVAKRSSVKKVNRRFY